MVKEVSLDIIYKTCSLFGYVVNWINFSQWSLIWLKLPAFILATRSPSTSFFGWNLQFDPLEFLIIQLQVARMSSVWNKLFWYEQSKLVESSSIAGFLDLFGSLYKYLVDWYFVELTLK
jgi:hypothetical protein